MLKAGGKQILQHTLSYRNSLHGCRGWNTGQGDSLYTPIEMDWVYSYAWSQRWLSISMLSDRNHTVEVSALSVWETFGRWMQDQTWKSRVSCFPGNEYKPFLPSAEAGMKCSETIETWGQNLLRLTVVAPSFFFSSEAFASFNNSLK